VHRGADPLTPRARGQTPSGGLERKNQCADAALCVAGDLNMNLGAGTTTGPISRRKAAERRLALTARERILAHGQTVAAVVGPGFLLRFDTLKARPDALLETGRRPELRDHGEELRLEAPTWSRPSNPSRIEVSPIPRACRSSRSTTRCFTDRLSQRTHGLLL
jgi:hypothetical protein